jgi:hypothetical protein
MIHAKLIITRHAFARFKERIGGKTYHDMVTLLRKSNRLKVKAMRTLFPGSKDVLGQGHASYYRSGDAVFVLKPRPCGGIAVVTCLKFPDKD